MELGEFTSKLVVFGAVFLVLLIATAYFTAIKGSRREGKLKVIGAIVVAVLIALPFGWRAFVFNSKANIAKRAAAEEVRRCNDGPTAYQMSQDYVRKELSGYASLSFPFAPDGMQRVASDGNDKCVVLVVGRVEVRDINGRGEVKRYAAMLNYSGGLWYLKSLKL